MFHNFSQHQTLRWHPTENFGCPLGYGLVQRITQSISISTLHVDEPLLASPEETIKSLFLKNPCSLSSLLCAFLCAVKEVFFAFGCDFTRWILDLLLASYRASSSVVSSPDSDSDPSAAPDASVVSGAFVGAASFGRGEMMSAAISIRLMSRT